MGCGKSVFVLDLLEKEYQGVFKNLVMLCPTIKWNKAYKTRSCIGEENIFIVNKRNRKTSRAAAFVF